MSQFNIRLELDQHALDDITVDTLLDTYRDHHPSISRAASGLIELVMTVEAPDLNAATRLASTLDPAALPSEPVLVEVMSTERFDARSTWVPLPELLSVAEAASEIARTPQTVLNAIADGRLQSAPVGRIRVIPRAALETYKSTLTRGA